MRSLAILFLAAAFLVACKKRPVATTPVVPERNVPLTEPTLKELNEALQAWFTSRGKAPASFEELAKARFISKVPTPPPGRPYVIDPEKLQVVLK